MDCVENFNRYKHDLKLCVCICVLKVGFGAVWCSAVRLGLVGFGMNFIFDLI